jgi:hypothetical protein
MVKGFNMCKDSLEFYFLFFYVIPNGYHEKKQKNI